MLPCGLVRNTDGWRACGGTAAAGGPGGVVAPVSAPAVPGSRRSAVMGVAQAWDPWPRSRRAGGTTRMWSRRCPPERVADWGRVARPRVMITASLGRLGGQGRRRPGSGRREARQRAGGGVRAGAVDPGVRSTGAGVDRRATAIERRSTDCRRQRTTNSLRGVWPSRGGRGRSRTTDLSRDLPAARRRPGVHHLWCRRRRHGLRADQTQHMAHGPRGLVCCGRRAPPPPSKAGDNVAVRPDCACTAPCRPAEPAAGAGLSPFDGLSPFAHTGAATGRTTPQACGPSLTPGLDHAEHMPDGGIVPPPDPAVAPPNRPRTRARCIPDASESSCPPHLPARCSVPARSWSAPSRPGRNVSPRAVPGQSCTAPRSDSLRYTAGSDSLDTGGLRASPCGIVVWRRAGDGRRPQRTGKTV